MLPARHHLAWEEVADTNIRDERLVENVLRRGVELAADIVALEPARGRCNQGRPCAGIDAIVDRRHMQRSALEEQQQVAVFAMFATRRQLQVQAILFDVLEAEQVDEAERIMVARILLIVGADALGIRMRITGRVVVLQLEVWLPWQALRPIAAADDRCACMN